MSGGGWYPDDPEAEEEKDAPQEQEQEPESQSPHEPLFPEWPVYGPPGAQPPTYEGEPAPGIPASEALDEQAAARRTRDPLARLFPGLPRGVRMTLDWILTIVGAVLIVLALKQWVVNPYRIPSSSMEPTLNCAKGPGANQSGCLGDSSDRVLACRICLDFAAPARGDIVVFNTPRAAAAQCGEGGTFVKRLIGLPGETVREDDFGNIDIRRPGSKVWVRLREPYISRKTRSLDTEHFGQRWKVPQDSYFMMGDNRSESCDSRQWGSVPRHDLIGTVFFIYWPPDRIGFLGAIVAFLALPFLVGRRPTFL